MTRTPSYYAARLAGERLRRCYEVAPPRVRQYLRAEVSFILDRLGPETHVLELGCGYGRVLVELRKRTPHFVGIDTAHESLRLARSLLGRDATGRLVETDATALGIRDDRFDLVFCIQNGIAAFQVDPRCLVSEAIRVARPGGRVLFSSYSSRFWSQRLEWFRIQARHGLVGEIDDAASEEGVIVCKNGFRAGTVDSAGFTRMLAPLGIVPTITEVDGSSIWCEVTVP